MDNVRLQAALAEFFAPWVQALNLQVESSDAARVCLRLPVNGAVSRVGGILGGQAMMAAADTAMALALMRHFGEFRPCTTVQMSSTFVRPLSNQDGVVDAGIVRAGKSLVFGEVDLRGASDAKSVYRASLTYALL